MTLIPADRNNEECLTIRLFPNNLCEPFRIFSSQAIIFPPSKTKLPCEKAEKTRTRRELEKALFQVERRLIFLRNPSFHSSNSPTPLPCLWALQPSTDGTRGVPPLLPAPRKQAWEGNFLKTHWKALVLQLTPHLKDTFSMSLWSYLFPGKHWTVSPQMLACAAGCCLHHKITLI